MEEEGVWKGIGFVRCGDWDWLAVRRLAYGLAAHLLARLAAHLLARCTVYSDVEPSVVPSTPSSLSINSKFLLHFLFLPNSVQGCQCKDWRPVLLDWLKES